MGCLRLMTEKKGEFALPNVRARRPDIYWHTFDKRAVDHGPAMAPHWRACRVLVLSSDEARAAFGQPLRSVVFMVSPGGFAAEPSGDLLRRLSHQEGQA